MAIDFHSVDLRSPDDYLFNLTAPVTAVPITMSCIVHRQVGLGNQSLIGIYRNGKANDGAHYLSYVNSTTTMQALSTDASNWVASTIAAPATGSYAHIAGVWASTTSRTVYANGTAGTTETTSRDPSASLDSIYIAAYPSSFLDGAWEGPMSEFAIWDVALDADEIGALSDGASPLMIHPSNLVFYLPLVRDDYTDYRKGLVMTAIGSPPVTEHPRIYRPAPVHYSFPVAAGGGGIDETDLDRGYWRGGHRGFMRGVA